MKFYVLIALVLLSAGCSGEGDAVPVPPVYPDDMTGMDEVLPEPSVYSDTGIFVAPDGDDDAGDGSLGNPYRTIQHVLDSVVTNGATIILRGGEYPGPVRFRNPGITLRSRSGEWAVIRTSSTAEGPAICVQFDPAAANCRLSRVEVTGGSYYGIKFETRWDWGGPDRSGVTNVLIEDCVIHDTGRDCIKITPNCGHITIRRCEIYNSGVRDGSNAEGIDCVNGHRILVQDCVIRDIATTGLYFKGGSSFCILERTRISRCGGAGAMTGFDTSPEFFDTVRNPAWYESINCVIRNCLIRETGNGGISLYASVNSRICNNTVINAAAVNHSALYFGVTLQDWDPAAGRPANRNPLLVNNIVRQGTGHTRSLVFIRHAAELGGLAALVGGCVFANNIVFAEDGSCLFQDQRPDSLFAGGLGEWQTHLGSAATNCETDPLLNGDGMLLAGSPASGAGQPLPLVRYDIDGEPRGGVPDCGADQR